MKNSLVTALWFFSVEFGIIANNSHPPLADGLNRVKRYRSKVSHHDSQLLLLRVESFSESIPSHSARSISIAFRGMYEVINTQPDAVTTVVSTIHCRCRRLGAHRSFPRPDSKCSDYELRKGHGKAFKWKRTTSCPRSCCTSPPEKYVVVSARSSVNTEMLLSKAGI